jgi:hypothetical protein
VKNKDYDCPDHFTKEQRDERQEFSDRMKDFKISTEEFNRRYESYLERNKLIIQRQNSVILGTDNTKNRCRFIEAIKNLFFRC